MGGDKETSTQNVQDTSTRVTTTNTITTGDIGLTGGDAVEFAKAIQTGTAQIIQQVGDLAVPLVGGANALVQASAGVAAAAQQQQGNKFDVSKFVKENGFVIAAAIIGIALLRK